MAEELVSLLLMSMSWLASALDVDIMHTRAPVTLGDDSGMKGGSPSNDPRMDDGLNCLAPYYWYREIASTDVSM